jgi:hypothetical protein
VCDFLSSVPFYIEEIGGVGGESAETKQTSKKILLKLIKKILEFLFRIISL